MKNKKGFTLIELMAVVIVLIIIVFIAINRVNKSTREARDNTIKANAGLYIKAVNSYISVESIDKEYLEDISFSYSLIKNNIKINGTKPTSGSFIIKDSEVKEACLEYDGYKVTYSDGNMSNVSKGVCEQKAVYAFSYDGGVQEFMAPADGKYKVELWGAEGGNNGAGYGKGAYTSGIIELNGGDKLYIYIGGQGSSTAAGVAEYKAGGYNGGGYTNGQSCCGRTYGTGGGATDVRYFASEPSDEDLLVSSSTGLASRIMVAAGGGGGFNGNNGGNAGALTGFAGSTANGYGPGPGATQTSGGINPSDNTANGSFGRGGEKGNSGLSTGGGGGYYGGAGSYHIDAAGGGSSYISGHTGCVAIISATNIAPKEGCSDGTTDNECSIHYSNKVFTNTVMNAGNESMPTHDGNSTMTGNAGNGYAKITIVE